MGCNPRVSALRGNVGSEINVKSAELDTPYADCLIISRSTSSCFGDSCPARIKPNVVATDKTIVTMRSFMARSLV